MEISVSIVGLGFVGGAIYNSLLLKGYQEDKDIFVYDKYKNGGLGTFEKCLKSDILFLALPTPYDESIKKYNKDSIYSTCKLLSESKYSGVILMKSTVEPETTQNLSNDFPNLYFIHNPEFLTARTAFTDFHNQKHIVLGKTKNLPENKLELVFRFYKQKYEDAIISVCSSIESESMKIFCNTFYAVKVQFFTELYLLCQKNGSNFDTIRDLMIRNEWIHPMHTKIPGPDGNISFGGLCLPKDSSALNQYMIEKNVPNMVVNSTILERNNMRND